MALIGAVLVCTTPDILPGTIVGAQQNTPRDTQQPSAQRDDPATSGAGPTSRAPGQLDDDDRKGVPSTTTDARGVTTTHPQRDGATTDDPPADYGNESMGATAPR